jgi:hypothetical protein
LRHLQAAARFKHLAGFGTVAGLPYMKRRQYGTVSFSIKLAASHASG